MYFRLHTVQRPPVPLPPQPYHFRTLFVQTSFIALLDTHIHPFCNHFHIPFIRFLLICLQNRMIACKCFTLIVIWSNQRGNADPFNLLSFLISTFTSDMLYELAAPFVDLPRNTNRSKNEVNYRKYVGVEYVRIAYRLKKQNFPCVAIVMCLLVLIVYLHMPNRTFAVV